MDFLKKSALIVTGHDDGTIRLWNPEIGKKIKLETK